MGLHSVKRKRYLRVTPPIRLATAVALAGLLVGPAIDLTQPHSQRVDFVTSTNNGQISVSVQSFQGAPMSVQGVVPPPQMTWNGGNYPTINTNYSLLISDPQPALGAQTVTVDVNAYLSCGGGCRYNQSDVATLTFTVSGNQVFSGTLNLAFNVLAVSFTSSDALVSNPSWAINPQSTSAWYNTDWSNGQGLVVTNSTGQVAMLGANYQGEIPPGTSLSAPINTVYGVWGGPGYMLLGEDGGTFGQNAPYYGNIYTTWTAARNCYLTGLSGSCPLAGPIVDGEYTSNNGGYIMFAADGGVFNYGNAGFYGNPYSQGFCWSNSNPNNYQFALAGHPCASGGLPADVVAGALTYNDQGYWLLLSNGVVLPYGNAVNLAPITGYLTSGNGTSVPYQGMTNGSYPPGTFGISMPCWTACDPGFYDGNPIMAEPQGYGFVLMASNGQTQSFGQQYNYGMPNGGLGGANQYGPLIYSDMQMQPGYSRFDIGDACTYSIWPDELAGCASPGGQITSAAGVIG